MMPVVEVIGVSRAFKRDTLVLRDVSLTVQREEVVALLGRNGAGKTTLFQIVMGWLWPHSGAVRVFGLSPTEHALEVKRRIGYVGEQQILPPNATIPELIALHRHLYARWDDELEALLLERFGLAGKHGKIQTLSKGQAQQAALLLAVCHRPELLLLDEPAAGLDPAARREFLETSIQLLNREGTTILFASHHMGDVERLGGRVVLLDEGAVMLDKPLDDLRERYCIAVIPRDLTSDAREVLSVSGCLHLREVGSAWHVSCEGEPTEMRQRLQTRFGSTDIVCSRASLEELFVSMVGGGRIGPNGARRS
jgi:ABC-2 type transport system ATP-binding protein